MAKVKIQQAVNRISAKTKTLIEALKQKTNTQENAINGLKTTLTDAQTKSIENNNKKVNKQLVQGVKAQGADFENFTQLKELINDNELVSITLIPNVLIVGVVYNAAKTNPNQDIIIKGFYVNDFDTDQTQYGTITINKNLNVSGGNVFKRWKDISENNPEGNTNYLQRQFTPDDIGKPIRITTNSTIVNFTSVLQQSGGGYNVSIMKPYDSNNANSYDWVGCIWRTHIPISQKRKIVFKDGSALNESKFASGGIPFYNITKFEIYE